MSDSRRMFLKGTGGALMAIPYLTSLMSRKARAAYVAPKRFVAMSADHGVYEDLWYPTGFKRKLPAGETHTERDLAGIEGSVSNIIGKPFDGLKSKLLLIRGLDSALHFPNSNGHMRSTTLCGTLLNKGQTGPSIDIVLSRSAKVRLASTPLAHVGCGILAENHSYSVTAGAMKSSFTHNDSKQLFQFLFGNFVAPSSPEGDLLLKRKSLLLDSVLGNYRSVAGSTRIGTDDKRVLEEFATHFTSVEKRLREFRSLPGCQIKEPAAAPYSKSDTTQYERRMKELLDVLALALKCGVVQVAHFGFPTPEDSSPPPASNYAIFKHLSVPGIDFTLPVHSYSHESGNSRQTNPIFQRWLASIGAYFMTALDVQESAESPATYLDNSLVLYHNNLSNGSLHLRYDLPTLAAGSLGGRFTSGKYLDFTQNIAHTAQNSSGRMVGVDYNRWLVTLLQGFGLAEADYQQPGQPPGFGSDLRHGGLHPMLDTSKRRDPLPGILKRV